MQVGAGYIDAGLQLPGRTAAILLKGILALSAPPAADDDRPVDREHARKARRQPAKPSMTREYLTEQYLLADASRQDLTSRVRIHAGDAARPGPPCRARRLPRGGPAAPRAPSDAMTRK